MKNLTSRIILGVTFLWAFLMAHNTMLATPGVPVWGKLIMPLATAMVICWLFRSALVPLSIAIIKNSFQFLFACLRFLVGGHRVGARWMDFWESLFFFGGKGWLVDGQRKRLSQKASFESVVTVAGMGAGKTSTFIFPNLYRLDHCSMVITDTSGELFAQSSGWLKSQGYTIRILNLMDMSRSHGFNPLAAASSFTEISQLAHLLISSSPATGSKDDPFWTAGSEKLIRILLQCLKNRGSSEQCTLARLKELLSQFDHFNAKPGQSKLDQWILESTLEDKTTWQEYRSLLNSPEKVVQSFLSTADVALMAIGNPDLARLTARSDFDFHELRQRKTALYVMARQQDMSSFSFILNTFYTQLFNALMHDLKPGELPVYALLDEFGNLRVPNAGVIFTTARKYKVACWIMLQSLAQLEIRYSKAESQTILDGIRTEIYLAGTGLETAERVSRRLGRKRPNSMDDKVAYSDANLLNPDEIITMKNTEALLFYANKKPLKYKVLPYYKHRLFLKRSKMPAAELPFLVNAQDSTSDGLPIKLSEEV